MQLLPLETHVERQYVESLLKHDPTAKNKMGSSETKILSKWLKDCEKRLIAAFNEKRDPKQKMTEEDV